MSAAADLTPQGRAILEASSKFGDGKTLPFTPCKKYYNPFSENGTRMYACRLHSDLRMKRLKKEGGIWRDGEKRLDEFWKVKTVEDSDEKGPEINDDGCIQEKKLKYDNRKEKTVFG